MYISNMTHFINEEGNIPKTSPKEAIEFANFHALIVDATTMHARYDFYPTDIRCFNRNCEGDIQSEIIEENYKIHWFCPECGKEGYISEWEETRWNNLKQR